MSTESVGSCAGCGGAPPKLPLPFPRHASPFGEEQKFSPNTPDKAYKKSTICYRCQQEGHWARDCPNRSKESAGPSPVKAVFPKCPRNYPEVVCKNCQQPCIVRTSRTAANPGRDFYTCPRGQACKMFQWCDADDKIRSRSVNSLVKPIQQRGAAVLQNPICTCTAGPCRIETRQHGDWKGRKYFTCYLKSGEGLCIHNEWCDGLGDDGERKKNLNCNLMMTGEQNNTGMNSHGKILNKDIITSEEMDLTAFPQPPPTTPRTDHKTDRADSGSYPTKRPNLLNGSPSKRKCIEERVSERVASASLNWYLNDGPSNAASPGLNRYPYEELKTLEPNRETVGSHDMLVLESPPPLQSLNWYLNEGPSNAASPGLNRYPNEELKTLEPSRETVGNHDTLVLESPPAVQCSPVKRLSSTEGSLTKHEECRLCGDVGHGINDCDVLAQLAAS